MSKPLIVALLIVLAAGLVGWRVLVARQIAAEYAATLGVCAIDKTAGAAAIKALDRLHGETSRPSALKIDLSLCELGASVIRVQQTSDALKSLP